MQQDDEFGPNRTPVCSTCGQRIKTGEVCWCEDKYKVEIKDKRGNSTTLILNEYVKR